MNPLRTWARAGAGAAALAAALALSGCAPSTSPDVYNPGTAQRAQTVELGVVESLRPVTLAGQQSGVGAASGAALGGIAGGQIGHGWGSVAGAVGGALIGGLVGNAVEKDVTTKQGVEIIVRLDSGSTIAVAQEGSGAEFRPGDRVRVLSDGYTTRVTR